MVDILVIEDNEDNIELIDYVLRAHWLGPRLALSGTEGLRIAAEQRPDLILLDIRMPERMATRWWRGSGGCRSWAHASGRGHRLGHGP